MKWEIPVGQRSYIDTVERVFKHRLPGRKSEHYNVIISGLSATSETLKADIKDKILTQLPNISPAYSKLNDIYWDSAVLETTELPAITSVNVLSAAQVSTSSTQVASVVTNPVTTTESSDNNCEVLYTPISLGSNASNFSILTLPTSDLSPDMNRVNSDLPSDSILVDLISPPR